MKNTQKILPFVLVLVILCSFLTVPIVHAETANFTMKNGYVNIKARDILAIPGAFQYDESKYTRGQVLIDSNTSKSDIYDGQFFFHEGAGDTFTFTVDFGTFEADKFAYRHYGGSNVPTVFKVYADGIEIGTGRSTGGNGWLDNWEGYYDTKQGSFSIENPLSGVKTIVIEITSSSPTWPANNIGFFEFYDEDKYNEEQKEKTPDFTMTEDYLVIPAVDILLIPNAITRDSTKFFNDGHAIGVNAAPEGQEEYNGMFFIHSGAGDSFKFTVDFGTKIVDSMSFMCYGAAVEPTEFEIYANGEYLGTGSGKYGNGWEPTEYEFCNYDEFAFEKEITGVCEMEIYISSSSATWPANNLGMFTFYEAYDPSATEEPTEAPVTEAPVITEAPSDDSGDDVEYEYDYTGLIIGGIVGGVVIIAGIIVLVIILTKKKK